MVGVERVGDNFFWDDLMLLGQNLHKRGQES